VSISGAGPTSFALCASEDVAAKVADAMVEAYRSAGVSCTARAARPDLVGARVETFTRA
jgi:homoserine kinase